MSKADRQLGRVPAVSHAPPSGCPGRPFALIGRAFQKVMQFSKPPRAVQRVMFGLLGPIGRMRGYRGIIPSTPYRTQT